MGKSVNKEMKDYPEVAPPSEQQPEEVNTKVEESTEVEPKSNDEPRRLHIVDGPGNLKEIKWNRGGGKVPKKCKGYWNDKRQAQAAIDGAHAVIDGG